MNVALQLQKISVKQEVIELFVPDADVMQKLYTEGVIPFPYWSQVWPSSIALSEFIVCNRQLVQNKTLIELGAGLGLPSIVASRYAASVLCSDKEAEAVDIISKSVIHHKVNNLQTAVIDWNSIPVEMCADILMMSDINYEPDAFDQLYNLLLKFLKKETTVLLATPQRLVAKQFITPLLNFCVQQQEVEVDFKNEKVAITVLVLKLS